MIPDNFPLIDRDNLAESSGHGDPKLWPRWQKIPETVAVRMDGPFRVLTPHGAVTCQDGWLAVDNAGWPYPIAADEFANIYRAMP